MIKVKDTTIKNKRRGPADLPRVNANLAAASWAPSLLTLLLTRKPLPACSEAPQGLHCLLTFSVCRFCFSRLEFTNFFISNPGLPLLKYHPYMESPSSKLSCYFLFLLFIWLFYHSTEIGGKGVGGAQVGVQN